MRKYYALPLTSSCGESQIERFPNDCQKKTNDALYAWLMPWLTAGVTTIKPPNTGNEHESRKITSLPLLGSDPVKYGKNADGLVV